MHFHSIHVTAEYNLSGSEIICRQIYIKLHKNAFQFNTGNLSGNMKRNMLRIGRGRVQLQKQTKLNQSNYTKLMAAGEIRR